MKTARDYQKEIDDWAQHNFTYIDKVGFGIIEELGEYMHAHLKSRQRIRSHSKGGNKKATLRASLLDAVGDCMIYTLHWAEANGVHLAFGPAEDYAYANRDVVELEAYALTLAAALDILNMHLYVDAGPDELRITGQNLLDRLFALAQSLNSKPLDLLEFTWNVVKMRDWIKYPKTGRPE